MKVGWRTGLTVVLTLVASTAGAQPLSRFAEQKAEALLRDKLPCLGCHQFGTEGGRLAPDLATVSVRRSGEYIAAIVRDPQRVRPGTFMPRHPQPDAQEQLIIRYLATRPGGSGGTGGTGGAVDQATPVAENRSAGALYGRFCAGCHGASGAGDGPNAKSLPVPPAEHNSARAMGQRSDDALHDAIAGGGEIMARSPRMPAFRLALSPAEIQSLVKHIRELCKCTGPAWSTDGKRQ
ncbi:MAG TPA: cytochrome c [Gemmatimonadaceae bacterium]|nr:cytochrome c [Gemmatimonadaceae bacterium]